jgi:hypothetical protein
MTTFLDQLKFRIVWDEANQRAIAPIGDFQMFLGNIRSGNSDVVDYTWDILRDIESAVQRLRDEMEAEQFKRALREAAAAP